jgi:hypothetical protein
MSWRRKSQRRKKRKNGMKKMKIGIAMRRRVRRKFVFIARIK